MGDPQSPSDKNDGPWFPDRAHLGMEPAVPLERRQQPPDRACLKRGMHALEEYNATVRAERNFPPDMKTLDGSAAPKSLATPADVSDACAIVKNYNPRDYKLPTPR